MGSLEQVQCPGWYVPLDTGRADEVDHARTHGCWDGLVWTSNIWEGEERQEDVQVSSVS